MVNPRHQTPQGQSVARPKSVLKSTIANGLCVSNTLFRKRDLHLASSYLQRLNPYKDLTHKSSNNTVSNLKVIPNKECIKQHCMVVCDFIAHILHVMKCFLYASAPGSIGSQLQISQFQLAFKVKITTAVYTVVTTAGANDNTANYIESAWSKLKGLMPDAATKLCGLSKNHQ